MRSGRSSASYSGYDVVTDGGAVLMNEGGGSGAVRHPFGVRSTVSL
jgi:hypothetical protein